MEWKSTNTIMTNTYHKDGTLPTNGEIFVFGSNLAGRHGAGAAKVAQEKFGALYGYGTGLVGESFAIATKDRDLNVRDLDKIENAVTTFVNMTHLKSMEDTKWFVTRVGCGLAGFKDKEIAPLFKGARNCSFAEEWREYLE